MRIGASAASGCGAALEWRDVDREQSVAHVRRVVADGRVKEPKTERSRRRVPLTARAVDALESLPRRIDTRLVFPAPRGGYLDMHNLARCDWHPALDAAGLPSRRLYDLRHTFASNALAAGISLYELSRYMGASVRVLEMHYAHLVRDAEDAARAKLDAAAAARASRGVGFRAAIPKTRDFQVGRTERSANHVVFRAATLSVT